MWEMMAQISLHIIQSDLGLHCPFTESMDTVEYIDSESSDQTADMLLTIYKCQLWTKKIFWSCFFNYNLDVFLIITKTYLYNFDPLKPHFYIVKLGFTGVYIIFSCTFCHSVFEFTSAT